MRILYDEKLIKYHILFENLSNVKVKDVYLRDSTIWFVVESGGLYKAVGKNGVKVKRIENILKKKVRVIEENKNICDFCSNLIYPIKAKNIEFIDNNLVISLDDSKSKGLLIGRERKNLIELKGILSRHFNLNEIIVK